MKNNKALIVRKNREDIIFKALGGVSEVGATSYYIKWKGISILIDAGKRQNGIKRTPEYDEIEKDIDILFISHVHQDHIGSLMEYFDYFNFKKIVSTPETESVLKTILLDSKKILTNTIFNKLNRLINNSDDKEKLRNQKNYEFISDMKHKYNIKGELQADIKLLSLYEDYNIDRFIKRIEVNRYNENIQYKNLTYTLLNTSHLIGSCGFLFEDFSYKLFITSDFTETQKFFHPYTNFEPVYDKDIDTLITETTYGSSEESDIVLKENTLSDLESKINTVFNTSGEDGKGGNILIPAFAAGRTQEVILAILLLIKENRIPYSTQIRVPFNMYSEFKNLSHLLTEKYYYNYTSIIENELKEELDGSFENFVKKYLKVINLKNDSDFFENENQILIGTPGMLGNYEEYSYSKEEPFGIIKVALDIFTSKSHGIIFAGYQASGTLGHKIQNSPYGSDFTYLGSTYKRNTPHIYKVTFPGHVSAKGIMDLTKKIKPANLILTHGEINSGFTIAKAIRNKNIDVIVPDIEEDIYLMDNGRKTFFSTHHKFSNIILSLNPLNMQYSKEDNNILNNQKYSSLPIIKAIKKITTYDNLVNHIDIVVFINDENLHFYRQIEIEVNAKGYTSDLVTIDNYGDSKDYLFREILEFISEKALEFKEKFRIFYLSANFFFSFPFFLIAQILDEEMFILSKNNEFISIPALPVDIDINRFKYFNDYKNTNTKKMETIYIENGPLESVVASDFEELLDRLVKYKKNKQIRKKLIADSTPNQLPDYKKNSIFFKKDIFVDTNSSLWGEIENIYDVKNNKAVKILNYISDTLKEEIKAIEFTNYIFNYDNHDYYGEVLGGEEGKIFYRMVLENGIQYMVIRLGFKANYSQLINKLGIRNEA